MILVFVLSLLLIVFSHELAHLMVAKACGCGVEVFSIGFGKPILYKKKIGETIYQITPWLLGGYCKLKGELDYSRSKYAFTNLIYRKKLAIVMAGVVINIIMGVIAFIIGKYFRIPSLIFFGWMSFLLGATNAIPFPALDGSYPILVWLEKIYGKKKGYTLMNTICKIGFIIITVLNILCLPLLIYLIMNGGLYVFNFKIAG